MRLSFTKMQGTGNDHLLFDCLGGEIEDPGALARVVCDRRRGVGADGIALILPAEAADAKIRFFNSDGSEAQICGNALCCIGRLLYESSFAGRSHIKVETPCGVRSIFLTLRNGEVGRITVNMGTPRLSGTELFDFGDEKYEVHRVNIGNEHGVIFVDGIDGLDASKFARGDMNVELCEVSERNRLRVRVIECGVGETLACGSGACAATLAAISRGLCDAGRLVGISMPGGDLGVLVAPDGVAYLSGSAERVFDGSIEWEGKK